MCLAYALVMTFFLGNMNEPFRKGLDAGTAFTDDELSASDAADQLLLVAEDLRVAESGMADLGEPPDALKDSVRLIRCALERAIEGYELQSRGIRNLDLSMIEASTTLIQEGTAFLTAAVDATGEC